MARVRPGRCLLGDEQRVIFDAALAREADRAVDLLTQHLQTTAHHLKAIAQDRSGNSPAVDAATG